MNDYKELIEELRGGAEWAEANIYQVPIMLPNYLAQAAGAIEQLAKERDAALADLSEFRVCKTCKNLHDGICTKLSCSMCSKWEWRGVQK